MRTAKFLWCGGLALIGMTMGTPAAAGRAPLDNEMVEIRSYNLKPGTRDHFHQLFLREALPMLKRWKVEVVGYGPSLHDADSYYLMRAFPSVEARQKSEDAFYGSEEWLQGPRAAILADIDSYATIVVRLDPATLRGLRRAATPAGTAQEGAMQMTKDLETLIGLNADYIRSVQNSDVTRFKAILADDFLCSLPDGTLIDREHFLEQTAKPVQIANLAAHDVDVRMMGDMAIIHARTTFTAPDGTAKAGRYTDVWARRNGTWLAVSAHVTRIP